MTTKSIEVGERTIELQLPASMAVRYEITYLAASAEHRAYAAALGVCWGRLQRRVRYRPGPAEYGGRVIDYLVDQGWSYPEVLQAGMAAFAWLADGLIDGAAVREQEEDFGAAEEGST